MERHTHMEYVLLILTTIGISLQDLMRKYTTSKYHNPPGAPTAFNFLMTAGALAFFLVCSLVNGFSFHLPTLAFSLCFGVMFALAAQFNYQAIRLGSLSITSLVVAYSLIIPTFSGILFLKESFRFTSGIGILLLLVSLFLINGGLGKEDKPVNKKWFLALFLAFCGNGVCSTLPKIHQAMYPGKYRIEFMTMGMVLVAAVFFFFFLREKEAPKLIRPFALPALGAGLANGCVNLLVLVLASQLPAALMYPMISAGGIVITFLLSRFVFHEKLSGIQLTGFGIGILSIIALNL